VLCNTETTLNNPGISGCRIFGTLVRHGRRWESVAPFKHTRRSQSASANERAFHKKMDPHHSEVSGCNPRFFPTSCAAMVTVIRVAERRQKQQQRLELKANAPCSLAWLDWWCFEVVSATNSESKNPAARSCLPHCSCRGDTCPSWSATCRCTIDETHGSKATAARSRAPS